MGPRLTVRMAVDDIDVVDLLPQVKTPTIVFHCIHNNIAPLQQGRLLAASIPNAKFVSEMEAFLTEKPGT